MKRSAKVVVDEIIAAIGGIEHTISDSSLESFTIDWTKRHAVQRGIEIISEASRRPPLQVLEQHPDIPWAKIKAIGNILRHEYHAIADEVIWNIAAAYLPDLKLALITTKYDFDGDGSLSDC